MKYYFSKKLDMSTEQAKKRVTEALKEEGFGILTEIDVKATLKEKIDVDFRPYVILGACNPPMAHRALRAEDKIGLMLPCNVIVQEKDGETEVAAVDPIASMRSVENAELEKVAVEVRDKLKKVIDKL